MKKKMQYVDKADICVLSEIPFYLKIWVFYVIYVSGLPACIPTHHMYIMPAEARKGCFIPWNWSYRGS